MAKQQVNVPKLSSCHSLHRPPNSLFSAAQMGFDPQIAAGVTLQNFVLCNSISRRLHRQELWL